MDTRGRCLIFFFFIILGKLTNKFGSDSTNCYKATQCESTNIYELVRPAAAVRFLTSGFSLCHIQLVFSEIVHFHFHIRHCRFSHSLLPDK